MRGERTNKVAAYGAAAKGNTLLNYAGVRPDLLSYVADLNPAKQGKFLPGSRIPIVDEDRIRSDRPDWLVILPWNLKEELVEELAYIRDWGGQIRDGRAEAGTHMKSRYIIPSFLSLISKLFM